MRLQGVTVGYKGLHCLEGVTGGYKGLQVLTRSYIGLLRVTVAFKGLHRVKSS